MLLTSPTWVDRRVDSLRLDLAGDTRRHVSINFTLARRLAIHGADNSVIVPFAIMEKQTMRRLDTSDIAGKSSSILIAEENCRLSLALIMAAADRLLDGVLNGSDLRARAAALVNCRLDEAGRQKADFDHWLTSSVVDPDKLGRLDVFRSLSLQFARNFLFCAEIDGCVIGRRSVFKFAHDQDAPDSDRKGTKIATISQLVPDFGFAASQHIEVRAPQGLSIASLEVLDFDAGDAAASGWTPYDRPSQPRNVAHCSIRPVHRNSTGGWIVKVVPAAQGLYRFTKISVVAVSVMVTLGIAVRIWDTFWLRETATIIPSASGSILLVGPALLLSWMSRQQEHDLAARLLAPLRAMLLFCSVSLIFMAALAAVPVTPQIWNAGWIVIGLCAYLSLAGLILFVTDRPLPVFVRNAIYNRSRKGISDDKRNSRW
ncbi:hypothetical protein AB4Y80_15110 [Specibacter sp. RAF43]